MRIAYLVPGYSAGEADWALPGVQTHIEHASRRHAVEVFSLRWPSTHGSYAVGRTLVHALGGRRGLGPRVVALWMRAVAAIARRHRYRPFDLIHAFWADEPGLVAVLAGRVLGVPTLVSLQGGELVDLPDIGYGLRGRRGRATLVDFVLARASAVTACSEYHLVLARRTLRSALADRVEVAPLGVDIDRFSPAHARPTRGASARRVLGVGTLFPVKSWHTALEVVQHLDVDLEIVGEGPLRRELELEARRRGMEHRVRLSGARPYLSMPEVYANADVLLHTARHEALCVAVLEAAASGVAVVGTPVGVIPEVGVACSGVHALVDAVACLLDPIERQRQVDSARALIECRFSLEAVASCHEALYARLMAAS